MGIEINFNSNADEILVAMSEQMANGLRAIGMKAEKYAKQIVTDENRIDTGRMRNSITFDVEEDESVYIGTNVEYAKFHELGTTKIKPIHFLQNAATQHSDEYKHILETAMKTT